MSDSFVTCSGCGMLHLITRTTLSGTKFYCSLCTRGPRKEAA